MFRAFLRGVYTQSHCVVMPIKKSHRKKVSVLEPPVVIVTPPDLCPLCGRGSVDSEAIPAAEPATQPATDQPTEPDASIEHEIDLAFDR